MADKFLNEQGLAFYDSKVNEKLALKADSAEMNTYIEQVRGSNQNLLANWYFADPINQREQAVYTGSGYTIDRWSATEATEVVTVGNGGVTVSGPGLQLFMQKTDILVSAGQVFTASLMTEDGAFATVTGTMYGSGDASHQVQIGSTNWFLDIWENNGILLPRVYKISSEDESISLLAIKIELGPRQTLARQDDSGNWVLNDPPPDKTAELLKCRRYYTRLHGQLFTGTVFDFGDKKVSYCPYRYQVQMRDTPSISSYGTIFNRVGNSVSSTEYLTNIDGASTEAVMLWVEAPGDAAVGMVGTVYLGSGSYIEFSAEL